MQSKEVLNNKLKEINDMIPPKYWRAYHLFSIDNFIYHLDSIKNERVKEKVYNDILSYLDTVNTTVKEKAGDNLHDSKTVKDLFRYIYKIADPYRSDVGFTGRPSHLILVIVMVAWFYFLKMSFTSNIAALITIITIVLTIIFYTIKTKQKKIY